MESKNRRNKIGAEKNTSDIYTVDFSSHNLKFVPKTLNQYKNCKSLNLSCNDIESIAEGTFSDCLQLKELKLYANRLHNIPCIRKLTKLEELQLQFNKITLCGSYLKYSKNLRVLRLDSNKISRMKTDEVCPLINLRYIDVSSNNLSSIACLNVLTNVEEIHCTHNQIAKILNLHSLKKLREFDASNNELTDISGLNSLPNLSVLTLDSNKISTLESVGSLKSLQDLKISKNQVFGLTHVIRLFPKLEILDISLNKISNFKEVQSLLNFSTLKELSLYGNPVVSDAKGKQNIITLLNSLNLEVFDKVYNNKTSAKNKQPNVMRPLTVSQLVSTRLIEDQMNYSEICINGFEDRLKSQFAVVHSMLSDLPSEESNCTSPSSFAFSRSSSGRLVSQCSSRARIESAKAFAAEHF